MFRIFLSSPGDVETERDAAERVVARINGEHAAPVFDMVRWEDTYYTAESTFQAQIPKPSECDLVVCIFWKRLGSELPEGFRRDDGSLPTGSEYEFEEALQHAASSPGRLPDILVYRSKAEVMFSERHHELEKAQRNRFLAFWTRWFHNEKGHFVAGFQNYEGVPQFERLFDQHLRQWLSKRTGSVTWKRGSPFRGLEAFDMEHAPIFFGRERESDRVRARFLANALGGIRFLLLVGGSGSGKSSLVRAGLFARLAQPGGMGDLAGFVRVLTVTPSGLLAAGSWADGLAAALFAKDALGPALESGDFNTPAQLSKLLDSSGPSGAAPLSRALERMRGTDPAIARVAGTSPGALLILVDQLEELFSWDEAPATQFLALLQALVAAGPIYVVGTMRSDFWSRLADLPGLEQLVGTRTPHGPGQHERFLNIAPPDRADLREIIVGPATAAGLRYDRQGEQSLADIIEREADVNALPALQMLLAELYARRSGDVLPLAAYRALGGVAGVMAARGEEVLRSVGPDAHDAFARLARLLVSAGPANEPPVAARLPLDAIKDEAETRLATALRDANLLVSHDGFLKLAHESLIEGWDRLAQRVSEERRLFEVRDRVSAMCRLYLDAPQKNRRDRLLQGFALAEGADLLAKWGPDTLSANLPELPDFIRDSQAQARAARRRRFTLVATVSTALTAMALAVIWLQVQSNAAEKEARLQFLAAQTEAALRQQDWDKAVVSAGEAISLNDGPRTRSTALTALMEHSPYLKAVAEGRFRAVVWTGPRDVALFDDRGNASRFGPDGSSRLAAPGGPLEDRYVGHWRWGQTGFLQMRQDGALRLLPAMPGSHDAGPIVAPPTTSGIYVLPSQSDLRMDDDAVELVAADLFNGAVLRSCDTSLRCRETVLTGPAAVAAFAPAGSQFAVIREEVGKPALQIFDDLRAGRTPAAQLDLSEVAAIDGFRSLDWSPDGETLAIGAAAGNLVLAKRDGGAWKLGQNVQASGSAVLAVAWSPNGNELAYACGNNAICIAQPGSEKPLTPRRVLRGAKAAISSLSWSSDAQLIASVELSGAVRLWSLVSVEPVLDILDIETRPAVTAVAADKATGRIAAGDGSGSLWIVDDADDFAAPRSIEAPAGAGAVLNIALSADGTIAALYANGLVSLIGAEDKAAIRTEVVSPATQRIAWVGEYVAAVGANDSLVFIPRAGSILTSNAKPEDRGPHIDGLLGAPDGKSLITSHLGGSIRQWGIGEKDPSLLISSEEVADPYSALSLDVDPTGRWMVATRSDDILKIYDLDRKREPIVLPLYSKNTKTVAYSPDGKRLAALGADATIYVWDFDAATGAFSNQVAIPAVPQSAGPNEGHGGQRPASWISWADPHRLAVASVGGSILIVNFDRRLWDRRFSELTMLTSLAEVLSRLSQ